jgi:hypothetical protein
MELAPSVSRETEELPEILIELQAMRDAAVIERAKAKSGHAEIEENLRQRLEVSLQVLVSHVPRLKCDPGIMEFFFSMYEIFLTRCTPKRDRGIIIRITSSSAYIKTV